MRASLGHRTGIPRLVSRFRELRRALPLAASALLVAALSLPVWRITLTAPQYPGEDLVVEMYAYPRLAGDYMEVHALNRYVGFYYPDPVYVEPHFPVHATSVATPEWLLGPVVFLGLAALGVFVAVAPTEQKLRLGLRYMLAGTVATFTGMFVWIQVRLYQAGHSLDPEAPLTGIDGFTPPVIGPYEVANISGFAWFGPGGYLTVLAVALLAVAYLFRDSDATVGDLPGLLRELPGTTADRMERARAHVHSRRRSDSRRVDGQHTNVRQVDGRRANSGDTVFPRTRRRD